MSAKQYSVLEYDSDEQKGSPSARGKEKRERVECLQSKGIENNNDDGNKERSIATTETRRNPKWFIVLVPHGEDQAMGSE